MKHLVAVYGSLKKGFGNHKVMENANGIFIDTGITIDKFIMDGCGYPYITEQEKVAPVMVEVYEVDDNGLYNHLDVLEGHPSFYKRELRDIKLSSGKVVKAWIYIYQSRITPNYSLLKDNIWVWEEDYDY